MKRSHTTRIALAVGAIVLAVLVPERGQAAPTVAEPQSQIKHVVFILKENRSFDEYFGQFPNADGATTATRHDGTVVPLAQTPDPMPNDVGHSVKNFYRAYDNGKMDGFDLEGGAYSSSGQPLALSQMSESEIPNYWAYARRYGLGDRMFSDFKGNSFTNNIFVVAGQAGEYDSTLGFSWIVAPPQPPAGSPEGALNHHWGCDDPAGTTVRLQRPDGTHWTTFPCFDFQSLGDVLTANGVSWASYTNPAKASNLHDGFDAISSVRYSDQWQNIKPLSSFVTDAEDGNLPAVTWLHPFHTEHPPHTACSGENETVNEINAIMQGPDWSSTAIFITWDEWGGGYDHVRPPQVDKIGYGFRVPLLVISPWTKYGVSSDGGTIDDTTFSQSSFLRFVEVNWGLPSLTPRDQDANDMMDFFDFAATPKDPLILSTRTCPTLSPAERRLVATEDPD